MYSINADLCCDDFRAYIRDFNFITSIVQEESLMVPIHPSDESVEMWISPESYESIDKVLNTKDEEFLWNLMHGESTVIRQGRLVDSLIDDDEALEYFLVASYMLEQIRDAPEMDKLCKFTELRVHYKDKMGVHKILYV